MRFLDILTHRKQDIVSSEHELAIKLWSSGKYEAKLLSTAIEDPGKVTKEQIETQIPGFSSKELSDTYVSRIASNTPYALELIDEFKTNGWELSRRAAYVLLSELVKKNHKIDKSVYTDNLSIIEKCFHKEGTLVQEGMLKALHAISSIDNELHEKASLTAKKIGKANND